MEIMSNGGDSGRGWIGRIQVRQQLRAKNMTMCWERNIGGGAKSGKWNTRHVRLNPSVKETGETRGGESFYHLPILGKKVERNWGEGGGG